MTKIIKDKNEDLLEETIGNFLDAYPWLERRLNNMDQEHRDAVGILLETHPALMFHLKDVFDNNLDECGFDLKEEGRWYITREQYTMLGMLGLPNEGDELCLTNYKKGSGIIGLDGVELDSTQKTKL